MLPQQKEALSALISALVFTVLLTIIRPLAGGFSSEIVFIAILVFTVSLWISREVVGFRSRNLDEREWMIRYQAGLIAAHFLGAVFMVGAAVLYLHHKETMLVPMEQVALLAFYGWMSLYVSWAAAILVMYRRGSAL